MKNHSLNIKNDNYTLEKDMITSLRPTQGNFSLSEYLIEIIEKNALVGMANISDTNFEKIENLCIESLSKTQDGFKLENYHQIAIFITAVTYSKKYQRVSDKGFWSYLIEKLGFLYSNELYKTFQKSIIFVTKTYNRFKVSRSTSNIYYTTIMAHAFAPQKSFFALMDFLFYFYIYDLDYTFYKDDPAIDNMVRVLKDRIDGNSKETDEKLSSSVYSIQMGIKALISERPGFMKKTFISLLNKIDILVKGDVLNDSTYLNMTINLWWKDKTKPKITKTQKTTTNIAFSYSAIRVRYFLDENKKPVIRIPSIRLKSCDAPIVKIFSDEILIFEKQILYFGNEYSYTSQETHIPIENIKNANFRNVYVELIINNEVVYNSLQKLCFSKLLFDSNGNIVKKQILEEDTYTLLSTKKPKFDNIENYYKHSYFLELYEISMKQGSSIYYDDNLFVICQNQSNIQKIILPSSDFLYYENSKSYSIFEKESFSAKYIDENGDLKKIVVEDKKGKQKITIQTDKVNVFLVEKIKINFEKLYYFEQEQINFEITIDNETIIDTVDSYNNFISVSYQNGEIRFPVPKISFNISDIIKNKLYIWYKNIKANETIIMYTPKNIKADLFLGSTKLENKGTEYNLGQAVKNNISSGQKQKLFLKIGDDVKNIFDIYYQPSFTEQPKFSIDNEKLSWDNTEIYVGDENCELDFSFSYKDSNKLIITSIPTQNLLSNKFTRKSNKYNLEVICKTSTMFREERETIDIGHAIFGNEEEFIFEDEIIKVDKVIINGKTTNIKPIYLENIIYQGIENLGYTDLDGEYPHYKADMFFKTRYEKVYFVKFNPVDIYLVNPKTNIIHITFDDGEGFLIDYSQEYKPEIFKKLEPPKSMKHKFNIPDFFKYEFLEVIKND